MFVCIHHCHIYWSPEVSSNPFVQCSMSWKPDRSLLKRPFYLSVARALEHDIQGGFLAADTRLPTQRELADYLNLNFTTITRAYKICEQKGLIYAVTGCGTFVSPGAACSITISKDGLSGDCIDLGFVASFEECNHMIVENARAVIGKCYVEHLFNYHDPTGILHQKKAGLNWMAAFGLRAEAEQVAIVSGSQNALAITLLALFEPGQAIAVDGYTFSNFIELAKMHHIQLIPVPGDNHGMLPDALERRCRLNNISGVFLMPSCCNPTTVMISDDRKKELAAVIDKYQLITIEDDSHAFLTAGIVEDYRQPLFQLLPERTVYVCGTSKPICSGLRVAFMVFGQNFKEKVCRAVFNVNVKTSSMDAEIISDVILSGKALKVVEEKKRLARCANDLFDQYFPEAAGAAGHPLSFYRWLPISKNLGCEVEAVLKRQGVRVFHSSRFLVGHGRGGQFLRVSLASANSLERLSTGLKILRANLRRSRGGN
ncbi:PLP-dependent aminotransferase family protein [Deltaproteobacteria bacterium Smac51]|nr:PLP-dependent aminotransferase family protein [Deltaproteobacteria bacterium Smac51]